MCWNPRREGPAHALHHRTLACHAACTVLKPISDLYFRQILLDNSLCSGLTLDARPWEGRDYHAATFESAPVAALKPRTGRARRLGYWAVGGTAFGPTDNLALASWATVC